MIDNITPNNEKQESAGDMPRGKFQQDLAQYKTPAARLKFLRGLAAQIDALNISWTEAHVDEMQRISRQRLNYVDLSAEDIKRVSAAEPAFLRHQYFTLWPWSVGYINDGYNTPIVCFDDYTPSIEVLRAFRDDFAHVLDDRGAQSSLFGGGLTEEQREIWPNYYDIHPDLRRLYLLFAAAYITDFARHVRKLIDAAAGKLENYTSHTPEKCYITNSLVAQKTFDNAFAPEWTTFRVNGKSKRQKAEICVKAAMYLVNELGDIVTKREYFDSLKRLDGRDKQIHDAVGALRYVGNEIQTPQMIYRVMTRSPEARLPRGSEQYKDIIMRVKRMTDRKLIIDSAKQDKHGNTVYHAGLIPKRYEGRLIMGDFVECEPVKLNGQIITEFFRIPYLPVLFEYSADIGQMIEIAVNMPNLSMLKNKPAQEQPATPTTAKKGNNTTRAMLVENYIDKRVRIIENAARRGEANISKTIAAGTLYSEAGISDEKTSATTKQKFAVRKDAERVLETMKADKRIKNYEWKIGAHGEITGINLIFYARAKDNK